MCETLAIEGFAIRQAVIPIEAVNALIDAIGDAPHAVRNLIESVPDVGRLARRPEIREVAEAVLGPDAFVARAILFDKPPIANWKVTWHQDLTIAVRARHEVSGFGPWSEKSGTLHVQPPVKVLERMVTLRIHLDPCDAENGPLRVLPGSHLVGRLDAERIASWRDEVAEAACLVDAGGVVLMRPLILHSSSPATAPAHRRVIHLEFAAEDLPGELEWHGRW